MTATGHAIVGASLAVKVNNPIVGVPLAIGLHFILDKLPHWDPMVNHKTKTKRRILIETVADVGLGYLLVAFFYTTIFKAVNPVYLFAMAFACQLPDWAEIPYVFFRYKGPPFIWVYKAQKWTHDVWFDSRAQAPWGVITQILAVLIFLVWALI